MMNQYGFQPVTDEEMLPEGVALILFDEATLTNRIVFVAEQSSEGDPFVLVRIGEPLQGDFSPLREGQTRYFSRSMLGRVDE